MKAYFVLFLIILFASDLMAQSRTSANDTSRLKPKDAHAQDTSARKSKSVPDSVVWANVDSLKSEKMTTNELGRIGNYQWNNEVLIRRYNLTRDFRESITDPSFSRVGQKFNVVGFTKKGNAVIRFLDYTPYYKKKGKLIESKYHKLYNRDYRGRQVYFVVQPELIDSAASKFESKRVKGGLTFGVINFPFKWRPQNKGDFSGGFNFGAAVGYQFRHRVSQPWILSIITGYSISSIVLDSATTAKNQAKLKSTNNFAAFSFSLGGLIEYHKVQAGIFFGWDFLNRINQTEYNWTYHSKPWISIGIGLSVFSPQKVGSAPNADKNTE